jgi:pimeloyl-ACP methyl ester carboxylesterase
MKSLFILAFLFGALGLPVASAQSEVTRTIVIRGDTRIDVLSQGSGPLIVLLPSLGRGVEDFDGIAVALATARFRVLRPQPRGIGASQGPLTGITLHDYADDVAAVIEQAKGGPAFVVGHAFGNRVARLLATVRPDLVRAVGLIAANVGRDPSPPDVRAAIKASADLSLPQAQRLAALQFAFFAPGNDAHAWLDGWHPDVLAAERVAGDKTPREEDYAAGHAPVLTSSPTTIRWRASTMRRNTSMRSASGSRSWSSRTRGMRLSPSSRHSSRAS